MVQFEWMSKVFAAVGVVTSKKTHATRMSGARAAEEQGVDVEDIRRAGAYRIPTLFRRLRLCPSFLLIYHVYSEQAVGKLSANYPLT